MAEELTKAQQEQRIQEYVKQKGVNTFYFFRTTFERYKMHLKILRELKKAINEHGPVVTKEYVKGRENLVANPAITEYNKTATAANGTVATLMKILQTVPGLEDAQKDEYEAYLKSLEDEDTYDLDAPGGAK